MTTKGRAANLDDRPPFPVREFLTKMLVVFDSLQRCVPRIYNHKIDPSRRIPSRIRSGVALV